MIKPGEYAKTHRHTPNAVRMVVDRLGIRLTIGLNAIPMGVPHTRPTGVIAHGSRKELVAGYEPWVSSVQVPGTAGHLIEYRLGQAGYDAVGFAVHVPHYVSQADYPAARSAEVAPELGEWASFFAAGAAKRAAAEAGSRRAVTEREADDLVRDADRFLGLVEESLGLTRHLPVPARLPVSLPVQRVG